MSNKDFVFTVAQTIVSKNLAEIGSSVCVCLSGGADSVSLLSALCELKDEFKFRLSAIHINHKIRGAEADRDEHFCFELCQRLGVPFTAVSVNVPALHKTSGKSLEETARDARYAAFTAHAKANGIDYFATAHTASDNAETVLMNIIRGTTVGGLAGIPPKRDIFIRPLIELYRSDVIDYLTKIGQTYVTDSTNSVNDCTRNVIRNEILPLIRQINPLADNAINRLSSQALGTDRLLKSFYSGKERLSDLPNQAAIMVVRQRYEDFCGSGLTLDHAEKLVSILDTDTVVSLPNKVCAYIKDGDVHFGYATQKQIDKGVYKLNIGNNYFDNGSVLLYYGYQKPITCDYCVTINAKKVSGDMFYRSRRVGDTLLCLGVNKSVKKEFIDKKITTALRDRIPIVCDEGGIVCVPFIGADDKIFSREKDAAFLAVTFSERLDLNK